MLPSLKAPPPSTMLCSIPSVLIHSTDWPALMAISWGWKARPTVLIVGPDALGLAVDAVEAAVVLVVDADEDFLLLLQPASATALTRTHGATRADTIESL